MVNDIRWKQRFDQYLNSLKKLDFVVEEEKIRQLNEIEQAGKIQYFEMIYELSWKMLKDYLEDQGGSVNITGSKDAIKLAFNRGIILDGQIWMDMLKSRNDTSHIYDEPTANQIASDISNKYYPEFVKLAAMFTTFLAQNEI
jgi:nucleotidyltransferase substrate binding protein (TIGR01987 family)